jgi:hypothetical protein
MRGPAVEKEPDIVDEAQPASRWHIAGRTVGIEPRETLGPSTRDLDVVLDDRDVLFLGLAPLGWNFDFCGRVY